MAEKQQSVNRQFYSLPSSSSANSRDVEVVAKTRSQEDETDQRDLFLRYISDNVVGTDKMFSGPFGLRTVIYLDFVASGRALNFIEDYIRLEVLPEYGNTHTTTSVTSLQTTLFRHEARDILRNSFNASEHDSVIFTGSGSTGAVHKLIHALHLEENPSVVLVGPYEHHSNILPWKEAGAEVVRINQTEMGHIDINHLEVTLKAFQGDPRQVIGAFSAASNVTGILTDVDAVTICLHKHKALAIWDYACAAPYIKLDMNPYIGGPDQQYVYKDAVVLSVHKFVGGISTPGVLMAKKKLFKHPVPEGCGGGSVFFVRRDNHRYLQEPESKEEGGTPAIVQSIRAGLVVQLRDAVGLDIIHSRDQWLLSQAQAAWNDCPELIQLGPPPGPQSPDKLPIFSFLVLHRQTGRFLHHNFVAAVLNDVFGIQARGGCACAGPYAMDLLGLNEKTAKVIEDLIAEDSRLDRTHLRRIREYSHREILRPGFVRLNLPYFMDNECLQFVLEAVKMTAEHAWMLLPQYLFNPETAEWRQRHFQTFKDRKWLGHISYQSGQMKYHEPKQVVKGPLPTSYEDCLMKAKKVFEDAKKLRLKIPDQSALFDEDASKCRWFVLPSEASACLLQHQGSSSSLQPQHIAPEDLPFFPGRPDQNKAKVEKNSKQPEDSSVDASRDKVSENCEEDDASPMKAKGKTLEGSEITNSTVLDTGIDVSADAVSETGIEAAAEVESSQRNGISALEEALKYADALLKECGTNETTAAVNNAMSNIWQKFDAKSPDYMNMRNSKSSKRHTEEVTSAMNQIWNSFPVEDDKSGSSRNESNKLDSSAVASKTPAVNRESNKCERLDTVSLPSPNSSADVINDGLRQIWKGFSPENGSDKAELCQNEASNESDEMTFASDSSAKNETSQSAITKNSSSGVLDETNCTLSNSQKSLEKDKEIKERSFIPSPKGDASDLIEKDLGVTPNSTTLCESQHSNSAILQIQNAMTEIWNGFTPSRPRYIKTDREEVKISSHLVVKGCTNNDLVKEVINGVQRDEVNSVVPTNEKADTKYEEILSKSETEHDNIAKVKSAMSEIWELFTPKRPQNGKPVQTSDNTMKSNKFARLESAVSEAWGKCYGTECAIQRAGYEGARTENNRTDDKVDEVTSAMNDIRKQFEPETKMLSTEGDKLLPNSRTDLDTKSDKVAEVVNTMSELWEHFTPKNPKDSAEGGKSVLDNTASTADDTNSDNTISNPASRLDHQNDKVAEVTSAMNEIWKNFTPSSEKVNADEYLKKLNFSTERAPAVVPTNQKTDIKDVEILSKSETEHDNIAKVKSAMSEIWELFTPKRPQNGKPIQTSDNTMKSNKFARLENAMSEAWGKCYGTECPTQRAGYEGSRTENSLTNDKVDEVTNAMNDIRKRFEPENKMLSTEGDKLLPNSRTDLDTKSDKVAEVVNAMSQLWEHFTPKNPKDSAEGGNSVPDNSTSRADDTNSDNTISNPASRLDHQKDKVAEVTSAMNEIWKNFTPLTEKIDAEEYLKKLKFSSETAPADTTNTISPKETVSTSTVTFSQGMTQALSQGFGEIPVSKEMTHAPESHSTSENGDSSSQASSSHSNSEVMTAKTRIDTETDLHQETQLQLQEPSTPESVSNLNSSDPLEGSNTAIGDSVVCPLIKHNKDLLNKSAQRSTSKQTSVGVQWFSPPKQIFKPAVTALEEYAMLKSGDKVLVCLSGGKDSLSLLHTIRQYQFYARGKGIQFEFGAVTVDPMTPAYDPSPLKQYLASLGVPYFYESQCILETAEQLPYECASICSFCSRMKRGRIYAAARREGYNVLALGQHLDDLTESFLMSFFHNGNLNTMKAHYIVKQGDLRVIRPFVYVREADLRAFAEQCKLPIIAENCPACFEAPKERHRTKQLLAAQEVMFPQVYSSMMAALKPLMARGIGEKSAVSEDQGEED